MSAAGIIAAALFYALIGLAALLRPARLLEDFDILAETPTARTRSAPSMAAFR